MMPQIRTVGDAYKAITDLMDRGLKDYPLLGWDEEEFFKLDVRFQDELEREPVMHLQFIPLEEAAVIYDAVSTDET